MSVWFVTRHRGATEWARRRHLIVDHRVTHLDPAQVQAGDVVVGSLPVHLAATVCQRGAVYLHLSLDIPPTARGRELEPDELDTYGARLEAYEVRAVPLPSYWATTP